MSVVLDTGPLVAYVNEQDPLHDRAVELVEAALAGHLGTPVSTDYVLDEALTLLAKKVHREDVSRAFAAWAWGQAPVERRPFQLRWTDRAILREATEIHLSHFDQKLSVTDCTLIVHARRLGADVATFDGRFQGLIGVVDET